MKDTRTSYIFFFCFYKETPNENSRKVWQIVESKISVRTQVVFGLVASYTYFNFNFSFLFFLMNSENVFLFSCIHLDCLYTTSQTHAFCEFSFNIKKKNKSFDANHPFQERIFVNVLYTCVDLFRDIHILVMKDGLIQNSK